MNDRFKFRTYIPDLKFFKYWGWVEECHYVNMCACGDYSMPELLKNYTDQCTGLKDKNGKLIYELDYIRYANNKYKVEIDKFLGISLTNILNRDTIVMDDIVLFNCEVIGNEFESDTKI